MTDEGLLFNGFGSEFLDEPGKLPSDFLSQLVKAGDEGLNQVQVMTSFLTHYPRGDSMILNFTGRRPLPVRDYVISIEWS